MSGPWPLLYPPQKVPEFACPALVLFPCSVRLVVEVPGCQDLASPDSPTGDPVQSSLTAVGCRGQVGEGRRRRSAWFALILPSLALAVHLKHYKALSHGAPTRTP